MWHGQLVVHRMLCAMQLLLPSMIIVFTVPLAAEQLFSPTIVKVLSTHSAHTLSPSGGQENMQIRPGIYTSP